MTSTLVIAIWFLSGFLSSNVTLLLCVGHCIMRLRKNLISMVNAEEKNTSLLHCVLESNVNGNWLTFALDYHCSLLPESFGYTHGALFCGCPLLFLEFFFLA